MLYPMLYLIRWTTFQLPPFTSRPPGRSLSKTLLKRSAPQSAAGGAPPTVNLLPFPYHLSALSFFYLSAFSLEL